MTSLDLIHRSLQNGVLLGTAAAGTAWLLGNVGPGTWTAFVIILVVVTLASYFVFTLKESLDGRAILITGCDSGFGQALALKLDKMGCHVFAGCLLADSDGDGAKRLREEGSDRLHVLQLNITSQEQVNRVVKKIGELIPKEQSGLWGLVNNAGTGAFGEVEWVAESEYGRISEVNVIGTVRITKACQPLLRKAKGRIINVSSILGRFCLPTRAPYCSSKYALEAVSDCLRYEMRPWGVHVAIVEPGNFIPATGVFTKDKILEAAERMWNKVSEDVKKDYGKDKFDRRVNQMLQYAQEGETSMEPVLDTHVVALSQRYPFPRYQPQNLYYKVKTLAATHLPEWMFERLFMEKEECGTLFV